MSHYPSEDWDAPTKWAMQLDRAYFERHATRRSYIRPCLPGEMPFDPAVTHVRVTQVKRGVRVREFLTPEFFELSSRRN